MGGRAISTAAQRERQRRELADRILDARAAAPPAPKWRGYQRFRTLLGPEQLALIDDPAPLVSADTGRRGGKTTAVVGKILQVFERREAARAFYFAPTGEQGVDILWEALQRYNRDFDLGLREHWSDKFWTLEGRKLEIFSFHSRDDVELARGRWADFVDVDEAQLAPDWFAKKFEAAILPVIVDYRGQAWATGTPGEVADGFFFQACHDTYKWSTGHHWTANENPFFIAQGRDVLAEQLALHKWTCETPTFRREWLGLWVVDPDALVYVIPEKAIIAREGAGLLWYGNVLSLDLGWRDHDAIGATGVEPMRQWSHLRHMETAGQQTNHDLFRRLLVLAEHFPGPTIRDQFDQVVQTGPIVVYDPAGHATKKTIETFRSDAPGIHWVQADKAEKVQAIEWLNSDLREGTHTVETGNLMIKEALRLRWKRPGKLAEDADHSDPGDAFLYGHRHARTWLRRLPKEAAAGPPPPPDPFREHMAKLRAEAANAARSGYHAQRLRQLSRG